ncbi:MAG: D-alanine--D-alanine ligase family protein [Acidimicrobiales bacterium]
MSQTAVVFGGPSPEHDVSVLTGLQAARALMARRGGGSVAALYWSKAGEFHLVASSLEADAFVKGVPEKSEAVRLVVGAGGGFMTAGARLGRSRSLDTDVVLNCCHGGPGEDGTLSAALDLAGLAHAGPSAAGAALGMDKLAFGATVAAAGLETLPRVLLRPGGPDPGFDGPYIVKPRYGGSSIGIDVVADLATARARLGANLHLRAGAVIEPYRPDLFDLNIAVRSWPEPCVSAIERPARSGRAESGAILGYADKYVAGQGMAGAARQLPADIPRPLAERMGQEALGIATLAGVRGVSRIDFLSDGHELYVNEINTVPGSLAKYLWIEPVVEFEDLLEAMLTEATSSPAIRYTSVGADGTVLSAAGAIAGKLG